MARLQRTRALLTPSTRCPQLRVAALVAKLYGHDVEDQEVQVRCLLCLVDVGAVTAGASSSGDGTIDGDSAFIVRQLEGSISRAAKFVTRIVLRSITGYAARPSP